MALTRCRECGKKISTEAAACPHCGAPPPLKGDSQPKSPRTGRWRVLLTVFGILVLLWFIGLIARAPPRAIWSRQSSPDQGRAADSNVNAPKRTKATRATPYRSQDSGCVDCCRREAPSNSSARARCLGRPEYD